MQEFLKLFGRKQGNLHSGPIDDDEKSPTRIKNKRRGRNKNTTPFDPEVQDMIEQTQ